MDSILAHGTRVSGIFRVLADSFGVGPEPIGRWRQGQEVRVAAGHNSRGEARAQNWDGNGNLGPGEAQHGQLSLSTLGFQT